MYIAFNSMTSTILYFNSFIDFIIKRYSKYYQPLSGTPYLTFIVGIIMANQANQWKTILCMVQDKKRSWLTAHYTPGGLKIIQRNNISLVQNQSYDYHTFTSYNYFKKCYGNNTRYITDINHFFRSKFLMFLLCIVSFSETPKCLSSVKMNSLFLYKICLTGSKTQAQFFYFSGFFSSSIKLIKSSSIFHP